MVEILNNTAVEPPVAAPETATTPIDNAAIGATMVTADKAVMDTRYTPGENHPSIPFEPPAAFTKQYEDVYHKEAVGEALGALDSVTPNTAPETGAEDAPTAPTAETGEVSEFDGIDFIPSVAEEEALAIKAGQDVKADMEYLGPVEDTPPFEVNKDVMKTSLEALPVGDDVISMQQEKTDFVAMAAKGDEQQLAMDEMAKYANGEEGMLTKSFKVIDYIFAPAAAPGAALLAPWADPAATGSFLGDVWGNLGTMGEAFSERASTWGSNPLEHEFAPEYSMQIVEDYFPNIPEEYRAGAALSIELLTDPTIFLSAGLAKGMQASIKATRFMSKGDSFMGLVTDGLYKAMGWAPDMGIATVVNKELVSLARRADGGDREALVELSQKMAGKKTSVMGTENTINMVNSIMKADPNAGSYTVAKTIEQVGDVPEELLIKNIKELETKNRMQFNLHAINDGDDFAKTMDSAVEDYSAVYNDFVRESGMDQLEAAKSVNESLSHFMGKDIHHFSPQEAHAFIAIGDSSARQLVEFAQIMGSGVASPAAKDVARVAFAKQLKVHEAIQDRINQVGTSAGEGLQVFNTRVC